VILSGQGWVKRVRESRICRHAPSRGRLGAAVSAGSTRAVGRVLLEPRRLLRERASPTCRRRRATAIRCRSCSSSTTASAWSRDVLRPAGVEVPGRNSSEKDEPEAPFAVAVTRLGLGFVFSLRPTASRRRARAASSRGSTRATRSRSSRRAGPKGMDLTDRVRRDTTATRFSVSASRSSRCSRARARARCSSSSTRASASLGATLAPSRRRAALVIETEKGKALERRGVEGRRHPRQHRARADREARPLAQARDLPPPEVPSLADDETRAEPWRPPPPEARERRKRAHTTRRSREMRSTPPRHRGARGPRARAQAPRDVHRRHRCERLPPPAVGDPRQRDRRGDQRARDGGSSCARRRSQRRDRERRRARHPRRRAPEATRSPPSS
jgi:hypothetical protein